MYNNFDTNLDSITAKTLRKTAGIILITIVAFHLFLNGISYMLEKGGNKTSLPLDDVRVQAVVYTQEGESRQADSIYQLDAKDGDRVVLTVEPVGREEHIENAALVFSAYHSRVQITCGGELIYNQTEPGEQQQIGHRYYEAALPDDYWSKPIRISLEIGDHATVNTLHDLQIVPVLEANRSFVRGRIRSALLMMVLAVVALFLIILSFVHSIFERELDGIFGLSIFCLCIILWFIGYNGLLIPLTENAEILGYGLIENNNGGTISDCNIINAHIQKSGFSGTNYNQGTINNCHLYSDLTQYNDCKYFINAADTLTNGYLLLTVGLQSGSFSNVFSNDNGEAGFVENNSGTIEGCSFTGSVYGDSTKGTAGFFVTNSGTIENSYSNVVVNCGETANAKGAGFGITSSSRVKNCHSIGKINGDSDTIQAGFVYEVTTEWSGYISNCYSAIFDMNHNQYDDPFACKSWNKSNINAFTSQEDGFLNIDNTIKSQFKNINPLTIDQLTREYLSLYGSQAQTSNPYYVWMDTSAGNADPYPMPSYNGQTLASYGDWYDPDHIK